MAATILKVRLFLGSYAVLFGILAIRFTSRSLALICAGLAITGVVDNLRLTMTVRKKEAHSYKIDEVRDHGPEVAGYLATYLLPFVTVSDPSGRDLVGYALFLAVTCLIYVRSEMVQINPVIYVLGRRVFAVRTSDGLWMHLITRNGPEVSAVIDAVPLRGRSVMVEVARDDED